MTSLEEPSAKEAPEAGGEKLETKESGGEKQERMALEWGLRLRYCGDEIPKGAKFPRAIWRQISSSSSGSGSGSGSDYEEDVFPWDLPAWQQRDPRFRFLLENERQASFLAASTLRRALRPLTRRQRRRFRRKLGEIPLQETLVRIPKEALRKAGVRRLADLLLSYYGETCALEVAADALMAVGREDQADRLFDFARGKVWCPLECQRAGVIQTPDFSPRGAILKTSLSWFKRKIQVHTVALLYQMVEYQPPTFHLYLLPNDASVRKAVHEYEVQCSSQKIEKPPQTLKPLTIGCYFFVETNDTRICPKEVEFQYLDADKLQQYVELSAEQIQNTFHFSVMEKGTNELIWMALVTQKDLKFPESTTSTSHKKQGYRVMSPGMQRNAGMKNVWLLRGGRGVITCEELICKGREEFLKIIEKDLEFFLCLLCCRCIITSKEYREFQKAEEKETSEKLLSMILERGDPTCNWFVKQVGKRHPGSISMILDAVEGLGENLVKVTGPSVLQSESPPYVEEQSSSTMEDPAAYGENLVCNLCPCEDLPETIKPEVFLDSETNHERYRMCFTEAGAFLCLYTDVIFEVRGAVTITYHFDSWPGHLAEQNPENWIVAGPLVNIEADPAEAVAAVHFPHFLCLAGKGGSQVHIAHFVEGGMSLEKPDRVGLYHAVLENPNFSPRGAILKKSWPWFRQKIRVHTVALLYQMVQYQPPTFHLYLLPNDASLRKAVHEHEVQCPSQRIEKPPWTLRPLKIGCRFFVETNDARICPKEVEFQYLDADKLQQYVELSAEQMHNTFSFRVVEKRKNELIWETLVTQKDFKSPEMTSSPPYSKQGASCCTVTDTASSSTDLGHGVETRVMKKTMRDHLVSALENLREEDLNRFKFKLNEFPIAEGYDNIPQGPLEKANAMELSRLLLGFYMEDYAVQVTADVLSAINCRDEAEKLLKLTSKGK